MSKPQHTREVYASGGDLAAARDLKLRASSRMERVIISLRLIILLIHDRARGLDREARELIPPITTSARHRIWHEVVAAQPPT